MFVSKARNSRLKTCIFFVLFLVPVSKDEYTEILVNLAKAVWTRYHENPTEFFGQYVFETQSPCSMFDFKQPQDWAHCYMERVRNELNLFLQALFDTLEI